MSAVLDRLIGASLDALVLRAFVELDLPNLLNDGALAMDDLASRAEVDPDLLARFLRATGALGLSAQADDGMVRLTSAGKSLRDGAGTWAKLLTEPWLVRPWEALAQAVRHGGATFPGVHGVGFWEYLTEHAEAGELFDSAMASGAGQRADDLAQAVDLSKASVIVDVGGGHGRLVADLLTGAPHLRAVVADRADVLATAAPVLTAAGVADRVDLAPSHFFDAVPAGGDVYVLSRILHDWPDSQARQILTVCRAAMKPGAQLCILETVVPVGDTLHHEQAKDHAIRDLNMLVLVGGKERTAWEYEQLLQECGFALVGVTPGQATDILEARAANT